MKPLSELAQSVLESARGMGGPTLEDRARVRELLRARLADPMAPEPDLGPDPSVPWSPALKWGAAGAAAASAALLTTWMVAGPDERATPAAPVIQPEPMVQQDGRPTLDSVDTEPTVPVELAVEAVVAEPKRHEVAESASNEAPRPGTKRRARPRPAPGPTAPAPAPSSLADEARLLRSLQSALRDQRWSEALKLATQHRVRFAVGVLEEERLAGEAVAACKLGNREVQDRAMQELEARYPETVHTARIRDACR